MVGTGKPKTYAVTSAGLWRIRADLARLLDANIVLWPLARPGRIDGFVGWGRRPSARRADALSALTGKPVILIEDGFIKSYAPGPDEPAHSFVVDEDGIYFDATGQSRLQSLIEQARGEAPDLERARRLISTIRQARLSKYNNGAILGLREGGIPGGRPYVLLVDQVAGDASIAGALTDESAFAAMLEHAAGHHAGKAIVVRTHPAAGERSLLRQAARRLGIEIVVPRPMNPWPLLEDADAVYTVSSHLGFEALMAEKPVHCFGVAYFSGRGVTNDHAATPAPRAPASVEAIFHAAYIRYARYLDLHDRSECTIERAIEQAITVRDQRSRLPGRIVTAGMSPWKRKAVAPFLVGMRGVALHAGSLDAAVRRAARIGGTVAVWGSDKPMPDGVPALRVEDGFIRSKGLGVSLVMPSSIALDGQAAYYDARSPSGLEAIIAETQFDAELLRRAEALRQLIIARGVSKYNVGSAATLPQPPDGRMRILVPGQVEKDASIRFGSPIVKTNAELVAAVRRLYPTAYIAYKVHPDVVAGLRSGGRHPEAADKIVRDGDIMHWIAWADRVETMTSLAGFEALIRGKAVGVHGMPFYAGWGLTDDRHPIDRRTRRIDVAMLVAATLILYPFYVHPRSGMPCRPEDLVREIAEGRSDPAPAADRAFAHLARAANRIAVRLRDRRLG
ncbi:capsular polysaccharide biosynthesis protein [Mycoplana dimorpha]|uniref:Capsular polysaccharide export protein n=1 Tax=Mycoplana dimorpha TaxID=28320 RepID=A0A2T5B1M0_MYCDI|nr:capsular polysaccharide biosynthesis protein [Mycoplana dimorpha]PTM92834.1 capsular polysaccharide export protein [Mycoplana dimorpha]